MKDSEFVDIVDKATKKFRGNLGELETAIGMLAIGRLYGWKVLYLIHIRSTVRKYEKILGINVRELLPETAECTEKSAAYLAVKKLGSFWKAVKGEIKGIRTPDTIDPPSSKNKSKK